MRKTLGLLAGAALLAAAPALAQPSPNEERGMYIGDTHTNGSAIIVSDENGIHPQGFVGQAPINQVSATGHPARDYGDRRHHRRHHRSVATPY